MQGSDDVSLLSMEGTDGKLLKSYASYFHITMQYVVR